SAVSRSGWVTRSVKRRVTVSASRLCISFTIVSSGYLSPNPRAMMPRSTSRVPPRSEKRGRVLGEEPERPLERAAACQARLDSQQRVNRLRHLLLERRADVLDHGSFEVRVLSRLEHAGHRQGHLPQRDEMSDQMADGHGGPLARFLADLANGLDQ